MSTNIIQRTKMILNELPSSEKKIAEYIIKHPTEVITLTASELAQRANTSTAAIIRFCKTIEMDGFVDLKIKLSAENVTIKESNYSDVKPNEPIKEIKEKLLGNVIQSLSDTVGQLNDEKIEEVVQTLYNAPVIYTFGMGASFIVAEDISQKWLRLGKTVLNMRDEHELVASLSSAPEGSVFWGISNSGETKKVISLTKFASHSNIKTISLTQFSRNTLSSKSDIAIFTARPPEAKLRSAATTSLHMQFIAVEIVFFYYVSKQYDVNYEHVASSKDAVDQYKLL